MKLLLPIVSLVFVVASADHGIAQTQSVKFNHVVGSNGSSLGKISSLVQDKYGFMWLSDQTNQCIVRFDGRNMIRFKKGLRNPNSLGGSKPECLAIDSLGNKWIGFYGMGLDRFDPEIGTFTHFRHDLGDPSSLSNDSVAAVNIDHLGNVWVGTNQGLDLLNQETGKFTHYRHKEGDSTSLSYEWKTTLAYAGYGLLFLGSVYVIARIQNQRVINAEREKTRERELEQKKEIERAYFELKATQKQLIQSEKMASLGELTAGIAHEIQNPLNFVNNFSEVNAELISEMKEELSKGNIKDAATIADGIAENELKIIYHGKRAGAIVKGMLQHSRSSNGQKELTDINVLADEYLRLAFHGLRAKDKSFNANIKTDLDPGIGKINVSPQDIGRVILNLINNAFYAVSQRKLNGPHNGEHLEPTVTLKSKRTSNKVLVSVTDNGNGIPQDVLDKIFQPFFTTKPTGEGTGLGLSLSYDIITKGHDGEIKVDTVEGQGTTFTIVLPV